MRRSSSNATCDEDCTTAVPTPVHERSSADLVRAMGSSTSVEKGKGKEVDIGQPGTLSPLELNDKLVKSRDTALPSLAQSISANKGSRGSAPSTRTDSTIAYEGEGTPESPFVVDWAEHDPANPMRWNPWRKSSIVIIAGLSTLCVAYSSSAYAGGIIPMIDHFKVSNTVMTLGITFFLVGFAIGPMLWAPLSEIFGRRIIFLIAYGPFVLFSMGAALSNNIETLLIMRLLGGAFGSCPVTNSGGVTADMFAPKTRGLAMCLFAVAPFLGPTLGPICSGFLSESKFGWRANFWLMTIFAGTCFILNVFLVPETYAPVLLRKRAERLQKQTGHHYISALDKGKPTQTVGQRFRTSIFKPFVLLFTEAIVMAWAAFISAILYATFASYPIIFGEMRGWSVGFVGLSFLGLMAGAVVGIIIYLFENARYGRLLAANKGIPLQPEQRLPMTILGGICIPIALFMLAFTSYPHVHWIWSVLAGVPFGIGNFGLFLCSSNYMIDTYLEFAASALAANAICRALLGAVFPLFVKSMYGRLGNVWASALLGFISLFGVPIPYIFWKYGPYIRRNSKYAPGHAAAPPQDQQLAQDQQAADARLALDRRESMREIEAEQHPVVGSRQEKV